MAIHSDMDLILDMMPDESVVFDEVESGKNNEYYQGHAEHILKNIDTTDHYFHFVHTILKDYHKLSDEQKKLIQGNLGIKPITKEKVVYKEKIVYKEKKKPNMNYNDDY